MMTIIVAEAVAVEADLVEEAIGDNMAEEAVDAEAKVAEAEVAVVTTDKDDTMKTKGITLTLIFSSS